MGGGGFSCPPIIFSSVVLPVPLGPMMVVILPRGTSKVHARGRSSSCHARSAGSRTRTSVSSADMTFPRDHVPAPSHQAGPAPSRGDGAGSPDGRRWRRRTRRERPWRVQCSSARPFASSVPRHLVESAVPVTGTRTVPPKRRQRGLPRPLGALDYTPASGRPRPPSTTRRPCHDAQDARCPFAPAAPLPDCSGPSRSRSVAPPEQPHRPGARPLREGSNRKRVPGQHRARRERAGSRWRSGYRLVTPDFLELGVTNFFNEPGRCHRHRQRRCCRASSCQAANDGARVVVNTTAGHVRPVRRRPPRSAWRKNYETFGQTLGVWGVGEGPVPDAAAAGAEQRALDGGHPRRLGAVAAALHGGDAP